MFDQEIFINDNVISIELQNQIQELFEDSFFPLNIFVFIY